MNRSVTRPPNAIPLLLFLIALTPTTARGDEAPRDRAAWMTEAHFGVMTHYLADWIARRENMPEGKMTVERWNDLVDQFDVQGLADQVKGTGAGYYLITIGQNSGFYLSPNAKYDRIVGVRPSHCSKRDLVADLYAAMHKRGIRLMVYLPSGAPARDTAAVKALQWHNGPHRNREFQQNWEQVIREWSTRWGINVDGWWFDGCYWPNTMYRTKDAPNFESFAAAVRAGNPNAAIAFNPGVVDRLLSVTPVEDYTAGEINDLDRLMIRRASGGRIEGVVPHVLTFLGQTWGTGSPRFTTDQLVTHARKIAGQGGVMTFDTPIQSNGLLAREFVEQLTAVGKALNRAPAAEHR